MPIYEYECLQCGKRTEWLQSLNGTPLATCPHCGGEVRKLISAPAFQFKGSGFYKTDYADKDKKSGGSGKSESKSESKSENKSESSSENKAETKAESKSESKPESAPSAPAKASD